MNEQEKYRAVVPNDENYDGVFFYAVKSTGIFCRPSCKSKIPKRDNLKWNQALTELGISQSRMVDIFKDTYGMTPKTYMDSLRLEEAKRLLLETNEDILDIACAVGFGSTSAFYHFFKENEGKSPNRYRKDAGIYQKLEE